MNKKERVLNSLNHRESDIIPYSLDITILEQEKLALYYNDRDFLKKINNHIKCVSWLPDQKELSDKPGYFRDFFGSVWNKSGPDKDIGVVDEILIKEQDLSSFVFPKVDYEELKKKFNETINNNPDHFKMLAFDFSLFERAWVLRGMENLLMDMILDPDFVHGLMNAICEFNLRIIEFALAFDFDGIYFGDDWGQQKGLIMGPSMWREFVKPYLKKMYHMCKKNGRYVFQHSCGDIEEVFPDLMDIGLDCYNTFQPEIYDIAKIKNMYGDKLSFWGAISTQTLLPFASPQEVRNETIGIMKILGKNGGYIAAPTHAIPYDVPCENVEAMLEVFENQHKYL